MFSYQLYSSRNFPPMSRTFEMVSKAGYTAVEGYGALYADDAAVEATKAGLAATGDPLDIAAGEGDDDPLDAGIAEDMLVAAVAEEIPSPLPRGRARRPGRADR